MIENLMQTLPPNRHEALFRQLSLLDREIGDNTMEQVLDWEIGEFKRSIVMNEAGVKQRERAVELLRDYDFAQDISTRAFTIRRGRIPSDRDPGG